MEENRKNKRRSQTKIIPPKKDKNSGLSRDEVRSINKRKITRIRKAKRIAALWLVGALLICIGVILVLSVFFKINTVEIKGPKVYDDKVVLEKSGIEIGSNLFRINEKAVNEALTNNLPYIKNATLQRKLPDKLIITVTPAREVAAIQNSDSFTLIDETGKVLKKDSAMLRDGVAIINGLKIKNITEGKIIEFTNENKTADLIKLLKAVKDSKLDSLTEINLMKNGEFQLKYDNRIKIKIGSLDNALKKLQRASAALEKENEINPYSEGVLDLRTEPYAYFNSGKDEPTTKKPTTTESQTDEDSEKDKQDDENSQAND